MAIDEAILGNSSDDSLTAGKHSVEENSNDGQPEPIRRKARSWTKQWMVIKTAAGHMRVMAWTSDEPLVTGPKQSCPECSKKFDDPNSLKRHVRTHLGKSKNICGVCMKGFPDASKLKRHQVSLKHISPPVN